MTIFTLGHIHSHISLLVNIKNEKLLLFLARNAYTGLKEIRFMVSDFQYLK